MDLLSSIRKEGSRGGVNFSWSDVTTSQHRENYLGHSVMAPVGRWQKGKDLTWYAKGDETATIDGETVEAKKARERKEEIRRVKEAEEDALARALGLPVKERNQTGANAITVSEVDRAVKDAGVGEDEEVDAAKGFGDFVGKIEGAAGGEQKSEASVEGGLLMRTSEREGRARRGSQESKHRRHRHRSRSPERRRHRLRSGERQRRRHRDDDRESRRPRSRSVDRERRRYRSRSPDRYRGREERERRDRPRGRIPSPPPRDYSRRRDSDYERRR